MTKKAIITVDTGTTSMRAVLFSGEGRAIAAHQVENPPRYYDDGRVEQDPSTWQAGLRAVLSEVSARAREEGWSIEGIALTSQRSSVLPVDASGNPLHPAIMWQDERTESMCRAMAADSPLVYRKSGLKISPVFSAVKMRWFREARPDIYRKTAKMLGIQDFLIFLLTGKFVTDRSLASRTNLFSLDSGTWDEELATLFGVDRALLCDLVDPGDIVGPLLPGMAAATGIPEGTPVISTGGDQQCAALGMGLVDGRRVVANTGTGSYLIGYSDRPVHDEKMRLFCNVAAIPGTYIIEAAMLTSGVIYRWFREQFYASGPEKDFDRINEEVLASAPGANGVILLPHFKGAGAPHWNSDAKGLFYNIGLSTTRGDMARAVLEGIVFSMEENLDLIESFTGEKESVIVSGGLTRFDEFDMMQADIFGKTVEKAPESEATALGAWIRASVRLGFFSDDAAAFESASRGKPAELFRPDPARKTLYDQIALRRAALYRALAAAGF